MSISSSKYYIFGRIELDLGCKDDQVEVTLYWSTDSMWVTTVDNSMDFDSLNKVMATAKIIKSRYKLFNVEVMQYHFSTSDYSGFKVLKLQ